MNISKQLAELGSTLLKTTEGRTCARQQHGLPQKGWFKVKSPLLTPPHVFLATTACNSQDGR